MMDIMSLKVNLTKVISQRNIFLVFSILLSISVILLSSLLFLKKERIVIIPTMGPSLWVEESNVSDSYVEKMGSYLGDLLLTRTPYDVESKNKNLLEHIHPSFYQEARKQLIQEKNSIIASNQSYIFCPTRNYLIPNQKTYILEGELIIFIGKVGTIPTIAQTHQKRFILEFACERGKLLLKSLKQEDIS
jgi:conjugal transfer pilus assembly protein TraE